MQVEHAAGTSQPQLHPPAQRRHPPSPRIDLLEQVRHGPTRQVLGDDHVGLLLGARPQELHRVWVVYLLQHVQLRPAGAWGLGRAGGTGFKQEGVPVGLPRRPGNEGGKGCIGMVTAA